MTRSVSHHPLPQQHISCFSADWADQRDERQVGHAAPERDDVRQAARHRRHHSRRRLQTHSRCFTLTSHADSAQANVRVIVVIYISII